MLKRFELARNHTTVSTEFFGGLTSFLATFYIIIVNPAILSQAGLPFYAVCTATVLISAITTIFMGIYANNPIVLAPGMGLNAFFAFSVVLGKQIPVDVALGTIFWSGILCVIIALLKIREKIIAFIPNSIKYAVSCGIGIFITFIGLQKGGVVIHNPATLVELAPLTPMTITFFVALFICTLLVVREIKGALIIGIVATLLLSIPLGRIWGPEILIKWSGAIVQMPSFELFGQLNLRDSFTLSLLPVILSFMFTDLFDTISTMVGVCEAGGLVDSNGMPRNMRKTLIADSIATPFAAILGTSSTTSYIESAAGIQQGARTGLSSVFAGLFFLPFLFFSPLLSIFPVFTTAPILVLVGLFMMGSITKISWDRMDIALPAFLALILIPMTFSITTGLVVGIVFHYLLKMFLKTNI